MPRRSVCISPRPCAATTSAIPSLCWSTRSPSTATISKPTSVPSRITAEAIRVSPPTPKAGGGGDRPLPHHQDGGRRQHRLQKQLHRASGQARVLDGDGAVVVDVVGHLG